MSSSFGIKGIWKWCVLLVALLSFVHVQVDAQITPALLDEGQNFLGPLIPLVAERFGRNARVSISIYIISNSYKLIYDAYAGFDESFQFLHLDANFPRADVAIRNGRNANIAVYYTMLRQFVFEFPDLEPIMRQFSIDIGQNYDDFSESTHTPQGYGNLIFKALMEKFARDGMNMLGDEEGTPVPGLMRYYDYTDYEPKNSAFELDYDNRVMPNIDWDPVGHGTVVQRMLTMQAGLYNLRLSDKSTPELIRLAGPKYLYKKGNNKKNAEFFEQLRIISDAMGENNDYTLAEVDFWENKFLGPQFFFNWLLQTYAGGDTIKNRATLGLAYNTGFMDLVAWTWHYKRHFDYWRPFTAFRYKMANEPVYGWNGTAIVLTTGKHYQSFRRTMEHQDYPSGTSTLCSAIYGVARELMKDATGSYNTTFATPFCFDFPNFMRPNPELWPAAVHLCYNTLEEVEHGCSWSRVHNGVHFPEATYAARLQSREIGKNSYERVKELIGGARPF